MIDFLSLQNSSENPTFVTILFTVLLSFVLSSMIAFTHEKTTRRVLTPTNYLQTLVLVSIVAATVMQAIGDSLARGLGMLGALAIIRFRTTLRTPRNMAFIFAALAAGISCGVYGFVIGVTGTIGFCLIAFILRYSPMSRADNIAGILKFDLPRSSESLPLVEEVLGRFCRKYAKTRYRVVSVKIPSATVSEVEEVSEKFISYEYQLKLIKDGDVGVLDAALVEVPSIQSVKLNFEDTPENV